MNKYPITSGIKLVGIHGKAGSGKDTVARFLTDTFKNCYATAFASSLKKSAAEAFGISYNDFDDRDLKETINPNWGLSPRQIAQFFGTEIFRETIQQLNPDIGRDFWIKRLALRLNNTLLPENEGEYDSGDMMVISDVRFQNEYDWVISNQGIIIHLTRQGADGNIGILGHASELDINLHNKERTYTCENNGTILELQRKIANLMVATKY